MSKDKKNIDNGVHPVESRVAGSASGRTFHRVNKEIDQALAAINFTEFTQIDRPQKASLLIPAKGWSAFGGKIFGSVFLFILFLSGAAYFLQEGSALTNHLPADTKFYISFSLPAENNWYAPFLFWQNSDKPNQKIAGIYSRLNLISWDKASWQEKILPLLAGRVELAGLPSKTKALLSTSTPQTIGSQATAGGLLLRARLRDKAAWLKLFGSSPTAYQGEVVFQDLPIAGAWAALTKNPNKIAWQVLGNDLYLADNPGILLELNNKTSNSLSAELKKIKIKPGVALFYTKDKDSLALDNAYIKALSIAATYPLAIGFEQSSGAIKFNVYGQEMNTEAPKSTALAEKLNDFDSAFYGQNLATLYPQAEERLPDSLKNTFWPILKDFYGIDKAEALTEIGTSEIFLTFAGSDWLLNIPNNNKENNNLLALLKKAGQAGFAITHPQAVEQKLADGSKMIELRAETDGLDWQDEPWSWLGQSINLQSLKGQGEASGYFTGFIPNIGYILTTARPLLNQYIETSPEAGDSLGKNDCSLPRNLLMGASVPINNLTDDVWWQSLARKIIITMPEAGKISGCVVLLD